MTDLITEQLVGLDVTVSDKLGAINTIADLLLGEGYLVDREGYVRDVLAREALIETGIGGEIAIPHAQSASVRSPAVVYLRLRNSVDWGESGPGTACLRHRRAGRRQRRHALEDPRLARPTAAG